jgi:hypothetical protein
VNHNHWIQNQLLLQCVGVNADRCVAVEVGLTLRVNLDLPQRLKEPDNAHWAHVDRIAEETGHELLGIGRHLGSWILERLLRNLEGLGATSI